LAGTLFVHKIAGAMAEAGAPLDAIAEASRRVIAGTRTIGMSIDTCTVPGSPKESRIAPGMAELGLGIHGEAGAEQIAFGSAAQAMAAVVDKLAASMPDKPHVALLNNLGGASVLEMAILARELATSAIGPNIVEIVGPAAMMTSLDMHGFSVSVCPMDAFDAAHLRAPTPLAAWPGCHAVGAIGVVGLPDGLRPIEPPPSDHAATRAFLTRCCGILIAAEADLNALDAKTGDGDTGSTLAGAARALLGAMDRLPLADHTQLYRAIGQELSQTMGGSSGVLLAIFFTAAGDAACSGLPMREALAAGLERMQEIGGARPGDRTMIDALRPALDALDAGIGAAALAARAGADHTATLATAKAGRASYIGAAQLKGHVDPGAEAVARLFENLR
jgi:dihydroxyacetone kinase